MNANCPGGWGYHNEKHLFHRTRTKMTQTTTTPDQDQSHPATPSKASKANDSGRCIFRYSNHSRCRLQVFNHSTGLCLLHARSKDLQPEDIDDLSAELFEDLPDDQLPELQTPEQINEFLARVVVLLAEGRITPRRATVLTYAGSLLLQRHGHWLKPPFHFRCSPSRSHL
jgi:hypothetical protein